MYPQRILLYIGTAGIDDRTHSIVLMWILLILTSYNQVIFVGTGEWDPYNCFDFRIIYLCAILILYCCYTIYHCTNILCGKRKNLCQV